MKLTRSVLVSAVLVAILVVGSSWGFYLSLTIRIFSYYQVIQPEQVAMRPRRLARAG